MKKANEPGQRSCTGRDADQCVEGIDLDTPFHWASEEVVQPQRFFQQLHTLLPPDAILYFEGTTIASDVAAFYESHQSESRVAVVRDTLFPVPKVYHVGFSAEVVRFLIDQLDRRPVPEMFDHVKAYHRQSMLFTFHDAFSGWLCISEHVPEERVRAFFKGLNARYSREKTQRRDSKPLEALLNQMAAHHLRQKVFRAWTWICILTLILWCYPVSYRTTGMLEILGIVLCWAGALFLWRRRRAVTLPLVAAALVWVVLVSLPGRPVKADSLARDYCRGLRMLRGVRYVWGGEGLLGIDCSGLVRQGLIWGQFKNGLCSVNGRPIRDALLLWWNDCSAEALRDGFSGRTHVLFKADGISSVDHSRLRPGDLAVTADGVHVLAYLGNRTWIEADPNVHKVVEITLPTENPWFCVPVVLVRWECLSKPDEVRSIQ